MDMDECFSNAGIFDARQEERLHRHLDAVQCNADGAVCLVSSSLAGRVWDGCLWVYAAPFGQEERDELENQCSVATACHPVSAGLSDVVWCGKDTIAAADDTGALQVYRFDGQEGVITPHALLAKHDGMATCIAATTTSGGSAATSNVLTGGADGRVVRWDLASGQAVEDVRAHTHAVTRVAASSTHSALLASCALGDRALLWDMRASHTRPCTVLMPGAESSSAATSLAFSVDDTMVAVGTVSGAVNVLDMRTAGSPHRAVLSNYSHGEATVTRLAFASHQRGYLASCGDSVLGHVVDTTTTSNGDGSNGGSVRVTKMSTTAEAVARGLAWSSTGVLLSCGLDYPLIKVHIA
ncbi:methylosome protein WDR77-like [Sycon ciliatum]|uniref:methylosome protein WDR77-like n=1 Tax=Sycon ciliatum TaxID=27933 RepID=UPI0031F648AF